MLYEVITASTVIIGPPAPFGQPVPKFENVATGPFASIEPATPAKLVGELTCSAPLRPIELTPSEGSAPNETESPPE